MKWRGRRQSDNVVARRGSGGGKTVVGGGLGRIVVLIFLSCSVAIPKHYGNKSSRIRTPQPRPENPSNSRKQTENGANSLPRSWPIPKMFGIKYPAKADSAISSRNLNCSPSKPALAAGWQVSPRDRFTVPPIKRFTSILLSLINWKKNWAYQATSPRLT